MFFAAIFGITQKEDVIRKIPNLICRSCGRITSYQLVKSSYVFHLFFIPVFSWKVEYYLSSDCCKSIFELTISQGKDLAEGKDSVLDNLNLNITEENCAVNDIICFNCKNKVEAKFEYCPYCGSRIK
jgi:hypothetical protein